MIPKITDFNASTIPILNKILEDINLDKPKLVYAKDAPTTNNVNKGELHVYDDGDTIRRMYFKTHKGNLAYLNLGDAGDTFTVLPINRGGTYNTSFTEGKFLIYDGVRLTSSSYSWDSFASATGGQMFLKIDQTTPQTVVNGSPTFDEGIIVTNGKKIIFDGA